MSEVEEKRGRHHLNIPTFVFRGYAGAGTGLLYQITPYLSVKTCLKKSLQNKQRGKVNLMAVELFFLTLGFMFRNRRWQLSSLRGPALTAERRHFSLLAS